MPWNLLRVFGPLALALVFLALWQTKAREVVVVRAKLTTARADVVQREHVIATDRASYRAATVAAERQNAARIVAIEARHLASKKEADRAYATDLASAQRLAADYIATHRVQPDTAAATAGGHSGAGTAAKVAAVAAKPDRAGAAAVVVSEADIGICTENSVRLLNAIGWARGLGK